MKGYWIPTLFLMTFAYSVHADIKLDDRTVVVFATVEQGKNILSQRDDFVECMSPFDRAARMKTDKAVSVEEYLTFVALNVLPWDKGESARVEAELREIAQQLTGLSLRFPRTIYMIKTTGNEEGGAAYTRGNAIVLPKDQLTSMKDGMQKLITHELFHILSRENPKLRDSLYAIIGFEACNEIELPSVLKPRKITNPDAPKNDHYIRVSLNGKMVSAVPVLFSRTPKYDIRSGGEFFNYMVFKLLIVEKDVNDGKFTAVHNERNTLLVDVSDVSGFFEQVGKNSGYIIHPEEILADNFAILAGSGTAPSPQIVAKMRSVLSKKKIDTEPNAPADANSPRR